MMMSMRIFVRAPVMLITALVMALRISPELSRVFLVSIPLLLVAVVIVVTHVGPYFTALQKRTDDVNLVVQEDLNGIRVVKSFVREEREKEKFAARNETLRDTALRAFGFVVTFMPFITLIMGGTIVAVLWIGGHYVYGGLMLSGKLIAFFTYATEILMSLMMVSMVLMMLTRSIACAKRIVEVLDEEPEITDDAADPSLRVADGSIRFDHVYFKYHPTAESWNLDDVCLEIRSGMTVGILGGTGSAKTTLVSLIPRLYEATSGSVSVGGRDVRDYTMEALRDGCAMVLQKNTLFSGTIAENLRWGRADATDAELREACAVACADEFIDAMPDGYDTVIEQGGANVSGGQKQRLCIARAILRKPKILILDDSTSAVDTATDAKIRAGLRGTLPGTTKIIIAQRIASVMDADLIIVMDDGRISGMGTHDQLMASNQIYREVCQSQQEGVSIDG
jgi:ATP-binding cassette subfamily B protein